MSTVNNDNQLSFWKLISKISKIEIPIIQRDYAQGRDNDKTNKIRYRFLRSLINAIENNEPLELDFVYGNIENNIFQPLDGQQRLTTLFLLHWFIAQNIGKLPEAKKQLNKFTYETRISSREFCNELVNKGNNLGKGESISEQIKDSTWFFLLWENDPTIKAMLKMLEDIEKLLNGKKLTDSWTKLTSKNPPITFYFKELKDIGLTDDLYIKMNARGKELTNFEHIKALFKKHIDEKNWEIEINNTQHTFSHKIDTIWTDLFWNHRDNENLIDKKFVSFFSGIAINYYAKSLDISDNKKDELIVKKELEEKLKDKSVTDEAIKRERVGRRIASLFNNSNDVIPLDFYDKDAFDYLKKCLDIYSKNTYDLLLPDNLLLWDFCKIKKVKIKNNTEVDNTLFIEFIKDTETTYKQRVLFYAQTQYLLNSKDFETTSFSDWMRVVRNIVQNSTIDSTTTFIGAINLINEISEGCKNIYKHLQETKIKSSFASIQINEEILKSKIILDSLNNKDVIFSTEDTSFCRGKIKFPLYCIDFENATDIFKKNKLISIQQVITEYLNKEITNKFRSAMLTIRENDFYNYWGTWSYGTNSDKRCLIENNLDLKNNFTQGNYRGYLKDLLLQLVDNTLDKIINEYSSPEKMPNWKYRLIKEPQLQDKYCKSHYFGIPKDNQSCYLFRHKKRPSNRQECKKIK